MAEPPWTRDEPDSPCIKICVLDRKSGFCLGCLRTGDEIAAWPAMSPEARRALLADLPARRDLVKPKRRGGRSARASRAPGQ
ncbi:MAG TPA: DUF1289 domain-containing protein [Aliiroseovarius sp.]|nr:DUF1289 domain-containing protein [Aliiroseovarius sp.]